jgi:hypothetical protein
MTPKRQQENQTVFQNSQDLEGEPTVHSNQPQTKNSATIQTIAPISFIYHTTK